MTLIDHLAKQAAERSEQLAVVSGGHRITYHELDELSTRAACGLRDAGVRKGDPVGISYDHDALSVLSVYSIIKAGGLFVPLNPALPEARKTFIKNNTGIRLVLGPDADIRELTKTAASGGLPEITYNDPMAVIYTSGSTGDPKGVVLLHKNPLAVSKLYNETMGITSGCNIACYVSMSFIVATNDIASAVTAGAVLHFIPNDARLNIRAVADYFTQNNIVSTLLPVSFGRKLADGAGLPSLNSMGLFGERFIAPKAQKYKVFNVYGTTEVCGAQFAGPGAVRSIGAAAAELIGGEIVVSGDCVAFGYFGGESFRGKYHTGDLAEETPEGFAVRGRKDFQIKIRGYRIEPNEIDMKVLQVDGVGESVTVKRNGRLINYFSGKADITAIKSELSSELPKYMIPSAFVRLETLPKTLTGKIDRNSLPEPPRLNTDGGLPTSETEKRLADLWGKILNIDNETIGKIDSFAALGGDSLGLMMLFVEIEESLGVKVTPSELLRNDTLEGQAKLIEAARNFAPIFVFRGSPHLADTPINGGGCEPLFFAHTANSGPEVYAKFAAKLPENQPFYAFEHYNLVHSKFLGIKDLAEIFVDEMLKLYPNDRCALGGWSFGGLVAFEMALILESMGKPASRLYLIDPQICGDKEREIYEKLGALPYYREYLENAPLFVRFREAGMIEKLIDNNAFSVREVSNYKPEACLNTPATLFRMTLPDIASTASADEQELLSRLWELRKADNGFGEFTKMLKIINIEETHDRALTEEPSIAAVVDELGIRN